MSNAAQQIQSQLGVDNAMFNKQLKGAPSWSELEAMEDQIRDQIANTATMTRDITQLVMNEGVANAEFKTLATGVMRDLTVFADKLNVLKSKRNGRTNATNGPEEYTEYFSVGVEMTTLTEEMQLVVGNTLMDLTEFQHAAHEKIRAREEAQKATDVTEVTDVAAKEEPQNTTGPAAE